MNNLLRAAQIGYLDVLVVLPEWRRKGVASGLLEEVKRMARLHGWNTVRWITGKENNQGPKKLYDKVGHSPHDGYQMDIN